MRSTCVRRRRECRHDSAGVPSYGARYVCGIYAAEYLKTRHIASDGLAVRVEADKAENPARLSWFRIDVTTPQLEPRHQEGVLRAVKRCLVHNTLLHAPRIDVSVNGVDAPAVAA